MTTEFLSCNGHGMSVYDALAGFLRAETVPPILFGFPEERTIATYQGRYAIHMICRILNIGPGDEVLVPAFNCGAETDPFVWAGAKVLFYRIDKRARIDIEDIKRRVTAKTGIVYVTHFFGWPQDIEDLAKWCKERSLFLVEDCALCLFSRGPDDAIGRTGDAAIYSFVKTLATPDGGALVLKNRAIPMELMPFRKPPMRNTLRNILPLLKKWFMNSDQTWQRFDITRRFLSKSWFNDPARLDARVEREMPQGNYFDAGKIGWEMSRLTKGILNGTDPQAVVEGRRRNFRRLVDGLKSLPAITPLFEDLPDGVCPLAFPCFVENRSSWSRQLEERGILVGGWPSYHRGFDWTEFPEARHLKNDLLTLPVHQDLDERHMNHIIRSVKAIAGANDHRYGR